MAVLFSDNFNTGTEPNSTNWTEADGDWDVIGTATVQAVSGTTPTFLLTTASAHAATADVKVTVTQVDSGGDGGPVARAVGTPGAPTCYAVDVYTGACEIYRHNASDTSTLLRTASITQAANGVIALEVSGTGATVTLKQYYQGTQRGADVNDGDANRLTTANRTGIYAWTVGASGDYDDFQVEDLVAGGGGTILPMINSLYYGGPA
jgi:hypothetical protein